MRGILLGCVGLLLLVVMGYLAVSVGRPSSPLVTSQGDVRRVPSTPTTRGIPQPLAEHASKPLEVLAPDSSGDARSESRGIVAAQDLLDGIAVGASAEEEYAAIRSTLTNSGPASAEDWSARAYEVLSQVATRSVPAHARATAVECFGAACMVEFHFDDDEAADHGAAELRDRIAGLGWRDPLMLTGIRHEPGGRPAQSLILIRPIR